MWETIQSWFASKPKLSVEDAAVLERLIDLAHPHIRLAKQYQSRLAPYLAWAQAHAIELATRLPSPIALNVEHWRKNRLLQLVFATPDRMQEVVGQNQRLQTWFANCPLEDVAYLGLIADMSEKLRYGMSENAGQIQHDVAQKLLVFSRHQLGAPTASVDALLTLSAQAILNTVARQAQLAIAELEQKKMQIEDELLNARTMMRMYGQIASSKHDPAQQQARIGVLSAALQQIHLELSPDSLCERLITELAATPDTVRLETSVVNVNTMGLIDETCSETQAITLQQLMYRHDELQTKLILTLKVHRSLMLPMKAEFTGEALF